ncbi:hypothetical protein L6452_38966 [Arctium lappa]|uniref:Uncharacterized protein n=1 Tax=Arctium lappa TaxID=4217 RepID=A0ACB8XRM4_ARCLA|nr:hypothetical protein L6452_38966 [Arctium lappa]
MIRLTLKRQAQAHIKELFLQKVKQVDDKRNEEKKGKKSCVHTSQAKKNNVRKGKPDRVYLRYQLISQIAGVSQFFVNIIETDSDNYILYELTENQRLSYKRSDQVHDISCESFDGFNAPIIKKGVRFKKCYRWEK